MKTLLFLLILTLASVFTTHAQGHLSGHIRSADSMPIKNASVLLHSLSVPDKPLVHFTTSDNKGFYSLEIQDTQSPYLLTVKAHSFNFRKPATIGWR